MTNSTILSKLKEAGFFPDTMLTCLLVLECLDAEDIETLDVLDDATTSKRMLLLYYDLVRKELIEQTEDGKSPLYELTDKGRLFLRALYEPDEEKEVPLDEWIKDWIELWPKGVTTGGKLVRSDAKSCLTKMKKFFKDYKFSKEIVMEATKRYIESFESTNYAYIKAATYFIDKRGEGSELASWCEKILNTESEEVYTTINNGII